MDDEKLVEAVARAIVFEMGHDPDARPDELIPTVWWEYFTDEARAAIAVVRAAVVEECAILSESYDFGRRVYEANGATRPSKSGAKIAAAIRALAKG